MFGLVIILITLIICVSILFGCYMEYCSKNRVGMFSDPRYEERISYLEKKVKALEDK